MSPTQARAAGIIGEEAVRRLAAEGIGLVAKPGRPGIAADKRQAIQALLAKRRPGAARDGRYSYRAIARVAGVDRKTVAGIDKQRREEDRTP